MESMLVGSGFCGLVIEAEMGYFYAKQFRQTPFQKNSPKMQKIVKKYKNFPDCCPWERKGIPSALITKKPQKKRAEACPYHSLQVNDGKK